MSTAENERKWLCSIFGSDLFPKTIEKRLRASAFHAALHLHINEAELTGNESLNAFDSAMPSDVAAFFADWKLTREDIARLIEEHGVMPTHNYESLQNGEGDLK